MTSRPADSVRSVLNLGRRDWTSLRITPTQARPLSRKPPTSPHVAHRTYSSYTTSYPSTHISKPPRHGQPLRSTHPRSIKEGELTPHVPKVEYEERRRRLMQSLPEGSVVVCMGGTTRLMTQQIFYKFRQSTDFFYLTGFAEPDAILVLESRPSTSRGYKMTMFVAPKDPHVAQWAGECSGVEGAMSIFGADEAHPHTAFSTYLPTYLRASHIYASLPPSPSPSAASQPFQPPPPRKRSSLLKLFSPSEASSSSSASSSSILGSMMATDPPHLLLAAALAGEKAQPLEREVQRLRLVKSKTELGIMKRAADISAAAHRRVMRAAQEGMPEGRLVAEFEYECGLGGSERPAYVPVVASGPNCLVIHYVTNDNYLDPGEMVLIDAGCEYAHYASDITRTFPVSGTFSDPQRDLYTAVLNAQKECVRRCRVEDGVSMNELHRASCGLLLQELRQIGFKLNVGDVERTLYPHFLSHHLGSDLHDCPTSDRNAALVEGNVITVEPGIYVPFDNAFPKHFHGMGVRVEDEVAFRKEADGGAWVLSEDAPKEVEEVERACQA